MDDCVLWTGNESGGYGRAEGGKLAHRVAYEAETGESIEGLAVHHLCGTPMCVNVAHLIPLTNEKHARLHIELRRAASSHCPQGHPWAGNEGFQTDRDGYANRYCKECKRIKAREWRAEKYVPHPKPAPTHCPQGHEYTPENTKLSVRANGGTKRYCRECNRIRAKANRTSNALDPGVKAERAEMRRVEAVEKREAQTHCKRGHEWTDENTYIAPDETWTCRTCKNDRKRARRSAD